MYNDTKVLLEFGAAVIFPANGLHFERPVLEGLAACVRTNSGFPPSPNLPKEVA